MHGVCREARLLCTQACLPYTQNEAALAVVMGHEVSHAIFQHGNERMSQELGAEAVDMGLQVALANKPAETTKPVSWPPLVSGPGWGVITFFPQA